MQLYKQIFILLNKEWLLEWRQRNTLNGLLLYVACAVFICYLGIGMKLEKISPGIWNALFWIIILFASVNAVSKSFLLERKGLSIYMYTLVRPQAVILSKIIYNALLMLIIALVALIFYSLVLGIPVQNKSAFILTMVLGAVAISSVFTMIAAIAAKAENSFTLMAVLGIPVVIPLFLLVLRLSKNAIDGLSYSVSVQDFAMLIALNAIYVALSVILFPFIGVNH
ncbi:MAG: heme exporter protein CcmB [Cytophagaceae bacterium]|nr:heme exporter protein CcmB [Cytophagaceae bacterium]MDW8455497.1 heme exporter protein CcmB [Cytophagaceae bacterium]